MYTHLYLHVQVFYVFFKCTNSVCVCVCVCVCVGVGVWVCGCVGVCVCMCVCGVCVSGCVRVCVGVCAWVWVCGGGGVWVWVCVCGCMCMCACVHACVHVCVWIILLSCITCTDSLTSGSCPRLRELVRFRGRRRNINIPREVGHDYKWFGYLLLEDNAIVWEIIMYREEPEHINLHILQEWLRGGGRRPATWRTLVQTLENIGLDELAWEIREALDH